MRSFWRWLTVMVASCGLFVGCGSGSSPQEPVFQYVETFNRAMTDSGISEPRAHERWAGELAAFYLPDSQAAEKERLREWIRLLGVAGGPNTYEIRDLKLEVIEETPTTAQYRISGGDLFYKLSDGEQVEPFEHSGLGQKDYIIQVAKVANKWYLVPPAR